MTIREHFREIQKPYTRWSWGFALVYGFGAVGTMLASTRKLLDSFDPIRSFWIAGVPFLIGFVGLVAASIFPLLRMRCPRCRAAIRGRWKRWRYCPNCAVGLDTELPGESAAGSGPCPVPPGGRPATEAMRISRVILASAVLPVALIVATGFLAYELSQDVIRNMMWKMEVETLSGYEGATRARHDFQSGRLRLFVVAGEQSADKFSGINDGPFAIWHAQYFPTYYPFRYSAEQMAKSYNETMKSLYQHPRHPSAATNATSKKDKL